MAASPLPPEYRRDDWPRLVAGKVNAFEGRIRTLEAGGSGGSLDLDGGNASGVSGNSFDFDGGGA